MRAVYVSLRALELGNGSRGGSRGEGEYRGEVHKSRKELHVGLGELKGEEGVNDFVRCYARTI